MLFQNLYVTERLIPVFYVFWTITVNFIIPIEGLSVRFEWNLPRYTPRNRPLSSPEECARVCKKGEPPKTCYYHFTLEIYTTLGGACQVCTPNATNTGQCQCVLSDGVEKGVLTINRMIPGPSIQVCEGDKVVVDVRNQMEGMEVTVHWHGILQRGTPYHDGVPMVTQCPILQSTTFRYQWYASNSGTHWYHTHSGVQKLDGLYGSIVVRQPLSEDPNSELYDYDLSNHVILVSDIFHEFSIERFPGRLHTDVAQVPDNVLINGKGQFTNITTGIVTTTPLESFKVSSGKRYRFRLINALSTVCPAQVTIEGHTLTVIATDGEPVKPVKVNTIVTFSGERYDFVVRAKKRTRAYWIQVKALGECGISRVQQLAILQYAKATSEPSSSAPTYDKGLPQGVVLNPLDAACDRPRSDAICINQLKSAKKVEAALLQEVPDIKIFLPFRFFIYELADLFKPHTYDHFLAAVGGVHAVSLVDNISYVSAHAPPLSQINDIPPETFCNAEKRPAKCGDPCHCTHKIDIPLHAIVEVIIVDEVQVPNLSHPFHLHGFAFNVLGMGHSPYKNVSKISLEHCMDLDRQGLLQRHFDAPPSKDTIPVPNNGYVVFRFRADNPGYWILHCHFLFHIVIGMNLIFHVGTQADLPPVPRNFPRCGDFLPPIS